MALPGYKLTEKRTLYRNYRLNKYFLHSLIFFLPKVSEITNEKQFLCISLCAFSELEEKMGEQDWDEDVLLELFNELGFSNSKFLQTFYGVLFGVFLESAVTTQDSNQTEVNPVTKMQAGHESSGNCFISVPLKL